MGDVRLSGVLILLTLCLIAVLTYNTMTNIDNDESGAPCSREELDYIVLDEVMLKRFKEGLRIPTVTFGDNDYDREAMETLVKFITEHYPKIHSSSVVTWQRVANHSLLYHIKGQRSHLKPYLLMAHLDVVPADASQWDEPPFSASELNGFVYARGTMDDKHIVFAILEALEAALTAGYIPERSFYIAYGHDEESTGTHGAAAIAKHMKDNGVQELEFILDEGLSILDGVVPGVRKPTALIGVSEKGYLTLQLSVNVSGGHSSMPMKESSIGILSRAVTRLEDHPHDSMFGTGPESATLVSLAPENYGNEAVNGRYFSDNHGCHDVQCWRQGYYSRLSSMERKSCKYSFRTRPTGRNNLSAWSSAARIFTGFLLDGRRPLAFYIAENVLASYATAIVNHRIHPSQTVQQIIDADKRKIGDDRVEVKVKHSMEPHPISPYGRDVVGYQIIKKSIRQIWGYMDVLVRPGLMVGATDTRHYLDLSRCIYRFSPTIMREEDMARFHGINERISVKNYGEAINFFRHIFRNADSYDSSSFSHVHDHDGL